jgi:hypothetical protein
MSVAYLKQTASVILIAGLAWASAPDASAQSADEAVLENDCASLTKYRDEDLVSEWNRRSQKFFALKEGVDALAEAERDLDAARTSIGRWGAVVATLGTVELVSSQIMAWTSVIASVTPAAPAAVAYSEAGQMGMSAKEIVAVKKAVGVASLHSTEKMTYEVVKILAAKINPITRAVSALYDLGAKVKSMSEDSLDRQRSINSFGAQLRNLRSQMASVQAELNRARQRFNNVQQVKASIDRVCGKVNKKAQEALALAMKSAQAGVSQAGYAARAARYNVDQTEFRRKESEFIAGMVGTVASAAGGSTRYPAGDAGITGVPSCVAELDRQFAAEAEAINQKYNDSNDATGCKRGRALAALLHSAASRTRSCSPGAAVEMENAAKQYEQGCQVIVH